MEDQSKSRTDEATPHPDASPQLNEDEKRALELSDEVEHTNGTQREEKTQQAERLGE